MPDDNGRAGKHYTPSSCGAWTASTPPGVTFRAEVSSPIEGFADLAGVLTEAERNPRAFLLRDTPSSPRFDHVRRKGRHFPNRASRLLPLDLDRVSLAEVLPLAGVPPLGAYEPGIDPVADQLVCEAIIRRSLPPAFHGLPALGVWSSSTGWQKGTEGLHPCRFPSTVSLHLWFIADEALSGEEMRAWCVLQKQKGAPLDPALYQRVQPIYIGSPHVEGTLPPDAPALLTGAGERLVFIPHPHAPDGWFGDGRDCVSAAAIRADFPRPTRRPTSRPSAALPPLPSGEAGAVQQRLRRYAEACLAGALRNLSSLQPHTPALHSRLYTEAHRLSGFAALGLLSWEHVRVVLTEAAPTSGTAKVLAHAEAHPDPVSADVERVARQALQTAQKQRRSPPPPSSPLLRRRLLTLAEARRLLPCLITEARSRPDATTLLYCPPGIGKTTAILAALAGMGLYILSCQNRSAVLAAVEALRRCAVDAEAWVGRAGPRLAPGAVWEGIGRVDGELVTCASAEAQERIQDGFRPFCGPCPWKRECREGAALTPTQDSLSTGYLGAKEAAIRLLKAGKGVVVVTQDMLPAILAEASRHQAPLSMVVVDEAPKPAEVKLTEAGARTLHHAAPELAEALSSFLSRARGEALTHQASRTLTPPQRAIWEAHGAPWTDRSTEALQALSSLAGESLHALTEAERHGHLQREVLALVARLAEAPSAVSVVVEGGGRGAYLATLAAPPAFPPGVPVLVADATADQRMIRAWTGRPLHTEALRLKAPPHVRALLLDTKTMQRGELTSAAEGEEISSRLGRILTEATPQILRVEQERQAAGLPLVALVVGPLSLQNHHPAALAAFLEAIRRRGWTVDFAHWQGRDTRGSNAWEGAGLVVSLGSPRMNLTAWGVQDRAVCVALGEALPPDDAPPDHPTRQRWEGQARAEIWQAHGRARSFTSPTPSPCLHVSVAPAEAHPQALLQLPAQQRIHRTLTGRPAEAAVWVELMQARYGLAAFCPALLSRLPGAPPDASLRRLCGGLRRWRVTLTGGGSVSAYAAPGTLQREIRRSVEELARLVGEEVADLDPDRNSFQTSHKGFRSTPTPTRATPTRSGTWADGVERLHLPPRQDTPSSAPPPVEVDAAEGATDAAEGSLTAGRPETPSKTPGAPDTGQGGDG